MKKFYKENRVFVILMGIALVCIAIIIAIFANYMINSATNDKYGNRLDGISDVLIDDAMKSDLESKILEMTKVQSATVNVHGKIINFLIDFENDATLDEAQSTSLSALELLEESYLNFYDMQFFITKSKLEVDEESEEVQEFPSIGYRKAGAMKTTWSNNANK